MKTLLLSCLFCFATLTAHAWVDGELLIWMDADRAGAIQPAIDKFQKDFGIHVRVETPEKITDNFPLAAQCGKGPDIVIWAHDKVGEVSKNGGGYRNAAIYDVRFRARCFATRSARMCGICQG